MQQPWNLLMRAKRGSKGPKVQAGGPGLSANGALGDGKEMMAAVMQRGYSLRWRGCRASWGEHGAYRGGVESNQVLGEGL